METQPRIFKWSLIIGIIVVLNLFFNYAISLFYQEPDYNLYFSQPQVVEFITTKEDCLKVGGQWNEVSNPIEKFTIQKGETYPSPSPYCDPDFTKRKEFENAQKAYNRNVFILLVGLGVISLIISAFVSNMIVSLGISWGGVLSLIIASLRYWSSAESVVKVLILAFALGALIWLAIKKFDKK